MSARRLVNSMLGHFGYRIVKTAPRKTSDSPSRRILESREIKGLNTGFRRCDRLFEAPNYRLYPQGGHTVAAHKSLR